jgi:hypothetical protein
MERKLCKSLPLQFKRLKSKSWGTIAVSNDTQIEHRLESMPAGTESCPYWYSMRLFKGTETSPGINKEPEYWLGICNVFLAPIIPIPIISDEIVIKLGDNLDTYHKLQELYGSHIAHNIMMKKDKFFHKIIDKATVKFVNSDIKYNNDEIWSA